MNYKYYIDDQLADTDNNTKVTFKEKGFNFSAYNAKKNFSYTIKFPDTETNKKIFKLNNRVQSNNNFPYQSHSIVVKYNGKIIISGNLYLLSFSDSFETTIKYNDNNKIDDIFNDEELITTLTKSGEFSNWLDWNKNGLNPVYNHSLVSSWGYFPYYDNAGLAENYGTSQHPFVGASRILEMIAEKHGVTIGFYETPIEDLITNLVIHCNGERDRNNNVTARFQFSNHNDGNFFINIDTNGAGSQSVSNSYYFQISKAKEDVLGSSASKFFARRNCVNEFQITFIVGSPIYTIELKRNRQGVITTVQSFTTDTTFSETSEKGDVYYVEYNVSSEILNFNLKVISDLEDGEEDVLIFPTDFYFVYYNLPKMKINDFVRAICDITGAKLDFFTTTPNELFLTTRFNFIAQKNTATKIDDWLVNVDEINYNYNDLLAKNNNFKFSDNENQNADYSVSFDNVQYQENVDIVELPFTTPKIYSGTDVYYNNAIQIDEHEQSDGTRFSESEPLILFADNTTYNRLIFIEILSWKIGYENWYKDYFEKFQHRKNIKVTLNAPNFFYRNINLKKLLYIKKFGKYYINLESTLKENNQQLNLLEID